MDARPHAVAGYLGAMVRKHGPDSPEAADVRRDLAASKINAAISSALTSAGAPLKPEHAAQLAARIRGSAS